MDNKPLHSKVCNECGAEILSLFKARYCSKTCRTNFYNRRKQRGAMIYDLAMRWRKKRSKEDLTILCHQIGIFIDCDRTDGRKSWIDHGGRRGYIPWMIPGHEKMNPGE